MTVQDIDELEAANLARRTPAGGVRRRLRPGGIWWPFALPAIILVAAFFVLPFLLNIRLAFTDWTSFSDEIAWNGLDNFKLLIDQNILLEAVRNTVIYAVVAMLVQNTVSLTLALALQETNFINTVFRSLFFIPVLIGYSRDTCKTRQ